MVKLARLVKITRSNTGRLGPKNIQFWFEKPETFLVKLKKKMVSETHAFLFEFGSKILFLLLKVWSVRSFWPKFILNQNFWTKIHFQTKIFEPKILNQIFWQKCFKPKFYEPKFFKSKFFNQKLSNQNISNQNFSNHNISH